MESGLLDIERILRPLKPRRIGRRIAYLASVGSTNDEAWIHLDDKDADGFVVLAEYQSTGRGRLGRTWFSPHGGGVLFSTLLIDDPRLLSAARLVLLTAVAVRDAIVEAGDVRPVVRWPNDLMVHGRKLAGILMESRTRSDGVSAYVIGVGINCLQHSGHFPPELAGKVTSLDIESSRAVDRSTVVTNLLKQMDRRLADPGAWSDAQLKEEWLLRAEPLGQRVRLRRGGRDYCGTAIDLDPTAALVVQLDEGGVRSFGAAETAVVKDGEAGSAPSDA